VHDGTTLGLVHVDWDFKLFRDLLSTFVCVCVSIYIVLLPVQ